MEPPTLLHYLLGAGLALIGSVVALILARRRGLFRYPVDGLDSAPLGKDVPISLGRFVGLLVFTLGSIGFSVFITSLVFNVLAKVQPGAVSSAVAILSLVAVPAMMALFILTQYWYSRLLGQPMREWLWEGRRRSVLIGAATLLIAFPLAELVMNGVSAAVVAFGAEMPREQLVVAQLRSALGHPVALVVLVATAVIGAPVIEEIFFRGYLQSWLRRRLDRTSAIFVAALVFALCHFRLAQGIANLAIIPAICLLGAFLGLLFERQRTLWAPITLHALFNATSIALILVTSG